MEHRITRLSLAAFALMVGFTFDRPASAQSSAEIASRRALLDQAAHARDSGNHAQALEFAQRAGRIAMSPSVRMFIAQEQRTVGQLAAALGTAEQCQHDAERDAAASSRDAIIANCRALLEELRPLVGQVIVDVPTPVASGLVIHVAGDTIDDALYGVPYIVTPGESVVEASAPDREPFSQRVTVHAGQTVHVAIRTPPRAGVVNRSTHAQGSSQPVVAVRTESHGSNTGTIAGVAVMVVGALAFGASALFYFLRQDALSTCTVRPQIVECPDAMSAMREQSAPTWNTLVNVSFIAGGVAIIGGGAIVLLSRVLGGRSERAMRHVHPVVGMSAIGLTGEF